MSLQGNSAKEGLFSNLTIGQGGSITVEKVSGATGGALTVASGHSTSGNNAGGAITIAGGEASGTSAGGASSLTGGQAGATGAGGAVTVQGGTGGATSGSGGATTVKAGTAVSRTATGVSSTVTIETGDDSADIKEQKVYGRINPNTVGAAPTTQAYPLGTQLVYGDRTFRYTLSNGAIAKGAVVQTAPMVAQGASAVQKSVMGVDIVDAAAGASTIVTQQSITCNLNEFAGGYLVIDDGTAAHEGGSYMIKSNDAAGGAACTLQLYDSISEDLADATDVHLVKNLYMDVITAPGGATTSLSGVCIGVAPCTVADAQYFWLQTSGVAGVRVPLIAADGALAGTTIEGDEWPAVGGGPAITDTGAAVAELNRGDIAFLCNVGGYAHGSGVTGFIGPLLTNDSTAVEESALGAVHQANIPVGTSITGAPTADTEATVLIINQFMA
jgi:hypothetical protein